VPISTTLDDPEGPLRTRFQHTCVFGDHHENLNTDRPILSTAEMYRNDSSFWHYRKPKLFGDIRGCSLERGRQTTVGLSKTSIFGRHVFRILINKANIVILLFSPSSPFGWLQNTWPWMTLNGHFTSSSVFTIVKVQALYLFTLGACYDDIYGRGIFAWRATRSTVIVGQLITAKKLWGVDRVFGVVWWAEMIAESVTFPGDQTQYE